MEVIKPSRDFSRIDELAERVFLEAVRSIGGLRKLTEYRNLTWLPSLAEAALVVVMREWQINYWLGHRTGIPDAYRDFTQLLDELRRNIAERHFILSVISVRASR